MVIGAPSSCRADVGNRQAILRVSTGLLPRYFGARRGASQSQSTERQLRRNSRLVTHEHGLMNIERRHLVAGVGVHAVVFLSFLFLHQEIC